MKIGIIGAGQIGKTLARAWATQGHEIKISNSRGAASLREFAASTGTLPVSVEKAVKDVSVIVIATPFNQIRALQELFDRIPEDVIVIETMNYIKMYYGPIEEIDNGMASSEWVQNLLGRPVIKALNNILSYSLFSEGLPEGAEDRIALPVSGDDQKSKKVVIDLINEIGFHAFDAGDIIDSWRHENGTPAFCTHLSLPEAKDILDKAVKEDREIEKVAIVYDYQKNLETIRMAIDYGIPPAGFNDESVNAFRRHWGIAEKIFELK